MHTRGNYGSFLYILLSACRKKTQLLQSFDRRDWKPQAWAALASSWEGLGTSLINTFPVAWATFTEYCYLDAYMHCKPIVCIYLAKHFWSLKVDDSTFWTITFFLLSVFILKINVNNEIIWKD